MKKYKNTRSDFYLLKQLNNKIISRVNIIGYGLDYITSNNYKL